MSQEWLHSERELLDLCCPHLLAPHTCTWLRHHEKWLPKGGGGGWGADQCQDLLVLLTNYSKTKSYYFTKKETNHPQFLNISPEIMLILQNMSFYAKTGSGGSKAINQNRWRSLYFGGFPIISTIAVNVIHNYNASRSSWAKASLETASKPEIQTIIRPTISLAEALVKKTILCYSNNNVKKLEKRVTDALVFLDHLNCLDYLDYCDYRNYHDCIWKSENSIGKWLTDSLNYSWITSRDARASTN